MQHAHDLETERIWLFGGERTDFRFQLNWLPKNYYFYSVNILCD
ncbi:hypothetical protein SAMN05421858_4209 [Haladaptatus litoreus]|uniref:Uncharacterized protein n=1 Tax=Haladaptatus litoreus TaxID=553468 RepID=A0A1N7EG37_9EURY|nr:hypothetical protein SAMN05421858_4209 [Haladaptatus litoreus]